MRISLGRGIELNQFLYRRRIYVFVTVFSMTRSSGRDGLPERLLISGVNDNAPVILELRELIV